MRRIRPGVFRRKQRSPHQSRIIPQPAELDAEALGDERAVRRADQVRGLSKQ